MLRRVRMDVTSLLNTSSAAAQFQQQLQAQAHTAAQQQELLNQQGRESVDQTPTPSATGGTTATSTAVPTPSPDGTPPRRTSGSRSPVRNRTPWDANGYSLPLTLDTKSISSCPTANKPTFYSESPVDGCMNSASPKSPRHQFSDSRSSLSSYTSSSGTSNSHSRISSLSTASEFQTHQPNFSICNNNHHLNNNNNNDFQPLTTLLTDISLNPRMPNDGLVDATSSGEHSASMLLSAQGGAANNYANTGYEENIAELGAVGVGVGNENVNNANNQNYMSATATNDQLFQQQQHLPQILVGHRPGSPSDAVMIPRGPNGGLGNEDSPPNSQDDLSGYLTPDGTGAPRTHKRSVSAPDFYAESKTQTTLRRSGRTNSHDSSSNPTATVNSGPVSRNGTPANNVDDSMGAMLTREIKCMFTESCDTNSQPRKAISHIFGRNKLCTRSIPDWVWVHYCRKHYQRSRYRNAQEYAKTQCDLVQQQIKRVAAWSTENQANNKSGVVQNWSLSVRKREQKRLDDKNARKKRGYQQMEMADMGGDDSDDEEDTGDRAVVSGTAVPNWLLDRCGSGFSTEEIMSIVQELRRQMDLGNLTQIPDIEILPNVITDGSEETKGKTYTKRKPSASTHHKRSQSVGIGLRPQLSQVGNDFVLRRMGGTVSTPIGAPYWPGPDSSNQYDGGARKRQCIDEQGAEFYANANRLPNTRKMERTVPVPTMRRLGMASQRPAFADIRESPAEDRYYNDQYGGGSMAAAGMGGGGPLPVPTSQRMNDALDSSQLSTASYQGAPSYSQPMRPGHQRSHSDASTVFPASSMPNYRPAQSSWPMHANGTPYGAPNGYTTPAGATPGYNPNETTTSVYPDPYPTSRDWVGDAPLGYYDEDPRPQQTVGTYATTATASARQVPSFYAPSPQPNSGGMARQHMRHQSQPLNMPRTMAAMGGGMRYTGGAAGAGPNQYSLGGYGGGGGMPTPYSADPQHMRHNAVYGAMNMSRDDMESSSRH